MTFGWTDSESECKYLEKATALLQWTRGRFTAEGEDFPWLLEGLAQKTAYHPVLQHPRVHRVPRTKEDTRRIIKQKSKRGPWESISELGFSQ